MKLTLKERNLLKCLADKGTFMWMIQLHTKMTYNEILKTVRSLKSKGVSIRPVSFHSKMIERLEFRGSKKSLQEWIEC
ncbi:hypothetical protein AAEO50_12305 [Rossellomorea oryzaecorticis]|uniref:Uncharacterized protein n=1 Tax=Rossellomorea oryzaecorticis TaxID=1396505 RepID=A0ABU9KAE1_9BACI